MKKKIILRTAWQTCNIGDICFTPAMCGRLRRLFPDLEIVAWAHATTPEIRALAERACSGLRWMTGTLGQQGAPADPEVLREFDSESVFLYNSGPLLQYVGGPQAWDYLAHNMTPLFLCHERGIPYAIYAQSMEKFAPPADLLCRDVLSHAAFVTCRDTRSCRTLIEAGVNPEGVAFSPDIAFGYDQRNETAAEAFLASQGLEPGRFLGACVHYAVETRAPLTGRTEAYLSAFRTVIERWVRETGLPVLLYPEDERESELHRRAIFEPLPTEIRQRVRVRDAFWLPDEAASVLRRARILFSMEPHSLLMTLQHGVPILHPMHWAFGCKAQMWDDLGLGDWRFDLDTCPADRLAEAVLDVHRNYAVAQTRAREAHGRVRESMRQTDEKLADWVS